MRDCQDIVDELRALLASQDQTRTELLRDLASAYAEHCRVANQRLRRCEEFLKRGLRGEAIQFAQTEPALLDVLAVLDFPERPQLDPVLAFYGLPPVPQLLHSIADSLNQAYADEQPLEGLLRQHRRLALARAPLPARLDVMRQLALLDAHSPVWAEDVRAFEEVRCQQLQETISHAASCGDVALAAEATAELTSGSWFTPPPAAHLRQAETFQAEHAWQQAQVALTMLVERLNGAVAASDLEQALALRCEIEAVCARAGVPPTDPSLQRAKASLHWVSQQERRHAADGAFREAVADVQAALDAGANPEEVTRRYHAALQYGRKLPRSLEDRYSQYMTLAEHTNQWRERLILLAVALVGAVILLSFIAHLFYLRLQWK